MNEVERMKYFKCNHTSVVVSSCNLEMATIICELACLCDSDELDIVEISSYEALGLFVESLADNNVFIDAVAIKGMFDNIRNEIVIFS